MESDRAAKIARANGVTKPAINMAVGVSATPKGEKTVWIVADAGGVPGDVTVVIDSQSGDVFSKSTQRGIPRR
jgi:hypothetical protein